MKKIKTIESFENISELCYSFKNNAAKTIYNAYIERRLSLDESIILFETIMRHKESVGILKTLLREESSDDNKWTIQ